MSNLSFKWELLSFIPLLAVIYMIFNAAYHNSDPQILNWNLVSQNSLHPLPNQEIITIDNFNLQSDFNLYNIYPYNDVNKTEFNNWIEKQFHISFNKILLNIADPILNNDLIENDNVTPGANLASTSKKHPDYFYQWIRDGAITINSLISHLNEFDSFQNETLQKVVENYIKNNYHLQRLDNWSGKFNDSSDPLNKFKNLGEPKFHVDSTPFNQVWGRPQNDGPALRIISIDKFIKSLNNHGKQFIQTDEIIKSTRDIYKLIIKLDLKFIIANWNLENFDLWEEVNSFHFFTSLTQLKALKIGLKYFKNFNDEDLEFGENLQTVLIDLTKFIYEDSGFINYKLNHIVETPSFLHERSGLDAAIIIGSLITHDDFDDVVPFDVNDGLILNTLSELIKTMKYLYPINHSKINLNLGVALGRYPEDIYDGYKTSEGNPWFLTTLSASELLFKLIANLYNLKQDLIIDSSNQHFYYNNVIELNSIYSNSPLIKHSNGHDLILKIPYNSLAFNQTIGNLFAFGDSFLEIIREHVSNDGSISEQFNKYTGFMQGAENLTWSYGNYWNAYKWRQRAFNLIG
ncbi:Glucoamylase, intracellular sporulation-specific [Wickerhamomyces ciferrii]|uniref:glucan 1,4-alpha-glucosidase n=1 Tax=Wickerhamomyces ciferrii (strain ATCC 14091 / BCRC 22168 / CBS 111 / JCM 3599 / NBRC 0793 / NRRL Y-1031 F-60-10) TaxID=1206466 RepID=K0KN56_WICCF|nr:Glucoamylase, intracellular sporulation-specific [Wickerhamomyces ciferrii]CCH43637.1 Glucoamylase, intracellular sporulation-specific [Wickerhamomyces ciferrii]